MQKWKIRLKSGEEILTDSYWTNGDKLQYRPIRSHAWKTLESKNVEYIDAARGFSETEREGCTVLQFRKTRKR